MIIKVIPLHLTTIPDDVLFTILDIFNTEINDMRYDINVNELILFIPKNKKHEFEKLVNELYNEAFREYINTKYSNDYRIFNAKIISFLDKIAQAKCITT